MRDSALVRRAFQTLCRVLSDERGQGLVEYVLVISLVAIALIGAVLEFQGSLRALYTAISTGL